MTSDERSRDVRRDAPAEAGAKLGALARRAEAVLVFERVWPALAWTGAAIALFLAASWLGLWFLAPRPARIVGVLLFVALVLVALAPLARLRRPTRAETLARVDRDAPAPHRPAASFDDRLAARADDPTTSALWDLHRRRLAEEVARLPSASPAPRMVLRDPRALRFAALLIAIGAGIVAGPERYARVAAAFDWRGATSAAAAARLDAWIDPPTYTGKPPIMIDVAARDAGSKTIVTPEGSILVVRGDPREIDTHVQGALAPVAGGKPAATGPGPVERRWTVRGDGAFTLLRDGSPLATFAISSIPIGRPTIALTEPPRPNLSGSLTLRYRIADRYGVASAEAEFSKPGGAGPQPRALVAAPKLPLQLPSTLSGVGEATTTSDLSRHPWAGAQVVMTLKATGLSGQVGSSAPVTLTLPQRDFRNPLARALVEQRRNLILDPDHDPPRLGKAIDALLIAPDVFGVSSAIYLGLRTVKARVGEAHGDADLVAVADLLWEMAVRIEDGDASQAQRDLRAAEQRLREALQRGASDEEIRKLTKDLRDAAGRYMRDLAQQSPPASPESAPMEEKDLDSLLDHLEDTARNGARQDAEAMLDQLQNMFENMRSARDANSDPTTRELRKQLGELEKLLRDQQALRDDTFRRDQRDRMRRDDEAQQPQPGDDDRQDGQPSLKERQRALRDRLAELQRRLKSLGMKGEKGFDEAQGDMKEAEGDLDAEGQARPGQKPGSQEGPGENQGHGDDQGEGEGSGRSGKGKAVDAQGRALQAMRDGAQGLQQQMQGGGQGGGYTASGRRPGGARQGRDPLGRDSGYQRGASEGSLNAGPDVAERARRVLEELRRRLADPNRPADERDYLERLLRRD